MKKLINEININSLQEAEEILKSAGTEDLFEKAKHNIGDMHPNGKWVWTQLPSGKFDWRVKKNNSGNVGSSPNAVKESKIKIDETSLDDSEYKRQYKMAMSVDNDGRIMGKKIIQNNIDSTKKELQDVIQKRPNAKTTILKLQKQLTTFLSQKKAVDDAIKEKSKKRPIGVGTNGPEKRKKESTRVDTLKYESKNGFKFKKNGDYKMRYNQREKAYEIWEQGDIYGVKTAMMRIKSENENIGMDIIKYMKEKYSKGGTMTYSNTTYAF